MKQLTTALVAVSLFAVAPAAAQAQTTVCEKAAGVRTAIVHKHGSRAPGRNICRFGIKHSTGRVEDASYSQKKRYLNALRRLNAPRQFLRVAAAGPPAVPPAGTQSPVYAPTGLAACIVQSESGGSATASNGTHFGIAQWDYSTWRAHHGPEMTGASDPRGASKQAQLQVLNRALAEGKAGAWTPYDPC